MRGWIPSSIWGVSYTGVDEDWSEVFRNIGMAIQVWGCLVNLLRREGADPVVSEKFYQEVVQAVLLFGEETWVLTKTML